MTPYMMPNFLAFNPFLITYPSNAYARYSLPSYGSDYLYSYSAFNLVSSVIQTNTGSSASIRSGGYTKDNTLGLSGSALMGSVVSIFDGATFLGNAVVSNGSWSFTTRPLNDGAHNFQIKMTYGGKSVTSNLYATVDTVAPSGTFSSTVVTNTGSTKTILSGGKTTDPTLGLSGTADAGSTVSIYDNGYFLGYAQLSGKSWRFNTQKLNDGLHTFTAKLSDQAGNVKVLAGVTTEVYTAEPIGTVSSSILTNTGGVASIANGGLTKDATLGFSGTAKAGSLVQIYDGNVLLGNAVLTGTSWSFTSGALADGMHSFQFKITNGSDSTVLSMSATVDTVATGTFSNAIATDTGATKSIVDGGTTSDHTLGLTGTAEAGSTVKLYDNGTYIGDALLSGNTWKFTTQPLTDGNHVFSSKIIDRAANETLLSGVSVNVTAIETPSNTWSNKSGWGGIDALAAINSVTNQHLADVKADASTPWGLDKANINDAWSYGYTGKGVTIALIDTGINLQNADLTQNLSKWNWNFVSNNSDVSDDNGHGTFVASEMIAANNGIGLTGAAYDAELMVLKALGSNGSGYASTIEQAMMYAVDHGADIINMSLGGGDYSGYEKAISYASSHNVLVVMSAGNSAGTDPLSPAIYAKTYGNALSVGALQLNADGTQSMASFSNLAGTGPYGYVDAAGQDVWGYGLDGKTYAWNGTSMAAPYAAAEAALILSANHSLTADQLVSAMTRTSYAVM